MAQLTEQPIFGKFRFPESKAWSPERESTEID